MMPGILKTKQAFLNLCTFFSNTFELSIFEMLYGDLRTHLEISTSIVIFLFITCYLRVLCLQAG